MKDSVMRVLVFVATMLCIPLVFAEDQCHHAKAGHEAHGHAAQPLATLSDPESALQQSMNKMQEQMDAVNNAKDPEERRRLLKEHNETMRASIKAMRELMSCMVQGGHMDNCHTMHEHSAAPSGGKASAGSAGMAEIAPADKPASAKSASQLWTCPMHPEVVQDHPGTCPICGMDLVKMDDTAGSKSGHSHMMGGGMNDHCMTEGKKAGMKSSGKKGGKKAAMKDSCMMGGCKMDGMMAKRTEMMLLLMEQMIDHNDAEMAVLK